MKFTRTLASVAAAAVAVSSLAVSAFAGSVTIADKSWWTEKEIALDELLDGKAAEDVVSFTFSGDTSFTLGYNNVEGGWSQVDVKDPSITLDDILITPMEVTNDKGEKETKEYYLKLCISKGDGVDYTFSWTVNLKATEPDDNTGDNETPDDNTGDNETPDDNTGDNETPDDNTGDNETPGDTEDPAEPGDTEKPAEPGDSDKPAEPGDSDKPAEPGDSDKPTEPGDDDNNKPGDTTKPAEPDDPIVNPDDNNKPADDDNNKPADDNKNPASPDTGVTAAVLPAALAAASLAVAGIVLKKRK